MSQEAIATGMVALSLLTSLIRHLRDNGALTQEQVTEIMDEALLSIETAQGSAPSLKKAHEIARAALETALKPSSTSRK